MTTISFRPELELLEGRAMLSAGSVLSPPLLTVTALLAQQSPQQHYLALVGEIKGTWTRIRTLPDVGQSQSLMGSGRVRPLGEVQAEGTLHAPGFIREGHTTGTLTLTNSRGSITLQLVSRQPQPGFSPPARSYDYTITGGTGAYAGATGSGRATLQESPDGTFTLMLRPGRPAGA
jgi:hypothetical protein